jgi:probable phosphoglycerate mutase
MSTTQILLIRHGQTAWNAEQRVRGQADIPLDERGLHQAELTARYVARRWPLAAVYASPLRRAQQTARLVARAQHLEARCLEGLLDISFGRWEGELLSDVDVRWPELARAWYETPHRVRFPDGEALDIVRERSTAALRQVAGRHVGETVALVAHTVVNRVLLCAVVGLGNEAFWRFGQGTCAVNLIEWTRSEYHLEIMNDTSHLWRGRGT